MFLKQAFRSYFPVISYSASLLPQPLMSFVALYFTHVVLCLRLNGKFFSLFCVVWLNQHCRLALSAKSWCGQSSVRKPALKSSHFAGITRLALHNTNIHTVTLVMLKETENSPVLAFSKGCPCLFFHTSSRYNGFCLFGRLGFLRVFCFFAVSCGICCTER